MAASLRDYSRLNAATAVPDWRQIYGEMHQDLLPWLEAANAQVPDQRLQLVCGPLDHPDPCGWTIRAQLGIRYPTSHDSEALRGQPVELVASWLLRPPGAVSAPSATAWSGARRRRMGSSPTG